MYNMSVILTFENPIDIILEYKDKTQIKYKK